MKNREKVARGLDAFFQEVTKAEDTVAEERKPVDHHTQDDVASTNGGSAIEKPESAGEKPESEPTVPEPSAMELVDARYVDTPTSKKFQVSIKWGELILRITEYGRFINDVRVLDRDGRVLFRSKKQSIAEAVRFLNPADDEQSKRMVIALRNQAKVLASIRDRH